jgi:hypothetical protein
MPLPAGGRLLFGWSGAGGEVPFDRHQHALTQAASRGAFDFDARRDVVPRLSAHALEEALRRAADEGQPAMTLHLLCHGTRDANGTPGLRWNASDPEGELAFIDAAAIRRMLAPHADTLRLVVLCACHGGDSGVPGNVLGSVAQAIHRIGVPAVVASRLPLSVEGSVQLTQSFYGTWDGSDFVQPALSAAKEALLRTGGLDWASLQLFATPGREGTGHRWRRALAPVLVTSAAMAVSLAVVRPLLAPLLPAESAVQAPVSGPTQEEQPLAGQVWNEDDQPVAGATVTMIWAGRSTSTITDASGLFRLQVQAQPQVSVRVMVEKEGYLLSEDTATLGNTGLGLTLVRSKP